MLFVFFLSVVLATGASWLVDEPVNPFNNASFQSFKVSRSRTVHNLWNYRFAIPILFRFKTKPFEHLRVSSSFHFLNLTEVYPLLLLPTFSGEDLGNPFGPVAEEHYDQANEPFHLKAIFEEVVNAYREKRSINYAGLAARFSLLDTMIALENFVKDFDEKPLKGLEDDTLLVILHLRDDLEAMTKEVYRKKDTANDKNFVINGLWQDFSSEKYMQVAFEFITRVDHMFWKTLEPHLTVEDRRVFSKLLESLAVTQNGISNLTFLAQLMREFPEKGFRRLVARILPLDFFQKHFTGDELRQYLRAFLEHKLEEGYDEEELIYLVELLSKCLTSDKVEDMNLVDDHLAMFKHISTYAARRYIMVAKKGEVMEGISVKTFEELNVPLLSIVQALHKKLVPGPFAEFVRTARNIRQPNGNVTVDLEHLYVICKLNSSFLPPRLAGVSGNKHALTLEQMKLLVDKLKASGNDHLIKDVTSDLYYRYATRYDRIPQFTIAILNEFPDCWRVAVKKNGLFTFQWHEALSASPLVPQEELTEEEREQRVCCSQAAKNQVVELANSLCIDQVGHAETALWRMLQHFEYLEQIAPVTFTIATSSLFLAQFGIINPTVKAFKDVSLLTCEQIIQGSKALKPHIYDFAIKLLNSVNEPIADRQEYLKMVHILFELLPAEMEDESLASYLEILLETIDPGAASEGMQVDVPGEKPHPMHQEIFEMSEHLAYILHNRVLSKPLLFKKILKRFNLQGSIAAIQLSENDRDFQEACASYFDQTALDPAVLLKLLDASPNPEQLIIAVQKRAESWMEWQSEALKEFLLGAQSNLMVRGMAAEIYQHLFGESSRSGLESKQ